MCKTLLFNSISADKPRHSAELLAGAFLVKGELVSIVKFHITVSIFVI